MCFTMWLCCSTLCFTLCCTTCCPRLLSFSPVIPQPAKLVEHRAPVNSLLRRRLDDAAVYFDIVVRRNVWNVFVCVKLKVLVALLVGDGLTARLRAEQGSDVCVAVDDRAKKRRSPAPVLRVEVHLAAAESLLGGKQAN